MVSTACKVISVASTKGGVGKSTIATNLAYHFLYKCKKDTLLIDADKQESSFFWSKLRVAFKLPVINTVSIVTNDIHKRIEEYKKDYEYIIIDSCGRDSAELRSGLIASDLVIIPSFITTFDVWALQQTANVVMEAKKGNPKLEVCVVLNKMTKNVSNATIQQAIQPVRNIVKFDTHDIPIICNRKIYQTAVTEGKSIYELPLSFGHRPAKMDIARLANKITGIL